MKQNPMGGEKGVELEKAEHRAGSIVCECVCVYALAGLLGQEVGRRWLMSVRLGALPRVAMRGRSHRVHRQGHRQQQGSTAAAGGSSN